MSIMTTNHQNKAKDLHTFSRILITLACFLLIGAFLPDNIPAEKEPAAFAMIGGLSFISLWFHFWAQREKRQAEQEEY
ncbi:YrhC family protein [Salibacterium aidingense]|uniref:YrhC family protein n=1 Tax=Salibacterium aidingense TaxID=384933 RepID=UPI00040442EE|nr:YrhC family protein [Salibacterium aidingense]